jgi:hypothetical protein
MDEKNEGTLILPEGMNYAEALDWLSANLPTGSELDDYARSLPQKVDDYQFSGTVEGRRAVLAAFIAAASVNPVSDEGETPDVDSLTPAIEEVVSPVAPPQQSKETKPEARPPAPTPAPARSASAGAPDYEQFAHLQRNLTAANPPGNPATSPDVNIDSFCDYAAQRYFRKGFRLRNAKHLRRVLVGETPGHEMIFLFEKSDIPHSEMAVKVAPIPTSASIVGLNPNAWLSDMKNKGFALIHFDVPYSGEGQMGEPVTYGLWVMAR